jgi:hypothetical protein
MRRCWGRNDALNPCVERIHSRKGRYGRCIYVASTTAFPDKSGPTGSRQYGHLWERIHSRRGRYRRCICVASTTFPDKSGPTGSRQYGHLWERVHSRRGRQGHCMRVASTTAFPDKSGPTGSRQRQHLQPPAINSTQATSGAGLGAARASDRILPR